MFKNQRKLLICFLIIYGLTLVHSAFAAETKSWVSTIPGFVGNSLIPGEPCQEGETTISCRCSGDCELKDFVIVAVNLFRLMLGVLGSLALLFFIYGGILFLLSRGSAEMIQRGKSILTQSLVGIMIVLGSWLIVSIVIAALTGQELGGSIKLFGQEWWRLKN